MKKNYHIFCWGLMLAALIFPLQVRGMNLLSDQQMDNITAGSNDQSTETGDLLTRIPFNYTSSNGQVDGEVLFLNRTTYNQTGILTLMDNAQLA
jgi:hypothetical protein